MNKAELNLLRSLMVRTCTYIFRIIFTLVQKYKKLYLIDSAFKVFSPNSKINYLNFTSKIRKVVCLIKLIEIKLQQEFLLKRWRVLIRFLIIH